MAPMMTLRSGRAGATLLGCVTLFAASVARAQVEPPPATSPPPATAAPSAPPAAPAEPPPAAAPAPPPATAPVTPLSPTMAPEPAAPPLVLSQRTETYPQPHHQPFYEKWWFWGAIGVVTVVLAIVVLTNLSSNENGPPDTTFGNMHAF